MWLWKPAVEPVLDATELAASRRIWCVTNGLMSLAPIHAAGDHSKGSTANTLSRIVSSYVSSSKALSYARKLIPSVTLLDEVLLVTMENTSGHQSLNVKAEEVVLRKIFDGRLQVLPQPSCVEVLDAMPGKPIIHLACRRYLSADYRPQVDSCLKMTRVQRSYLFQASSASQFPMPRLPIFPRARLLSFPWAST
jgi:hypothetical protein